MANTTNQEKLARAVAEKIVKAFPHTIWQQCAGVVVNAEFATGLIEGILQAVCVKCHHSGGVFKGYCMHGYEPPDISPGCGCKCVFPQEAVPAPGEVDHKFIHANSGTPGAYPLDECNVCGVARHLHAPSPQVAENPVEEQQQ